MTDVLVKRLQVNRKPENIKYRPEIPWIAAKLAEQYRNPRHFNKSNPFWELLFIICSIRTEEYQYIASFSRLRRAFPRFRDYLSASRDQISSLIGNAGLCYQKADCIIGCVTAIHNHFGKVTLAPLAYMSDSECEEFLTSLPRIGLKAARCVMMYSFSRAVFPVDSHCWRICHRLGWVRNTTSDGQPRKREMNRLQAMIPPSLRYSLHVNLVALGRDCCTAKDPKCTNCPITNECKQIGVSKRRGDK
ncbi:endonuclease III domain-containing protein [Planctomycetota bacterium]